MLSSASWQGQPRPGGIELPEMAVGVKGAMERGAREKEGEVEAEAVAGGGVARGEVEGQGSG